MYSLFLEIAIVSAIFFVIWGVRRRQKRPPGPWCLPFVGYLPWLSPDKPYATLTELAQKYGSIYGLWLGNVYTVVLTDHKLIKKTLMKDVCSGRAPLYLTHGIMNGYGLICAQGDLWKEQRKFVSSCLRNFGALKNSSKQEKLEELIKEGVAEFLQSLQEHSTLKEPSDYLPSIRHCLGNVINAIVFGCTWSSDDDVWNWLQILQEEGTKHIGVGGPLNFLPWLRFLPKYKRTVSFLIDGKIKTHKVYQSIIDEHKEILNENNVRECKNIIDAFLMEREKKNASNDSTKDFYCDQQFYHLLADVFGASLDTTLTTLRWFFLYLAAFPNEQTRIQEELDAVLIGRQPVLADIAALPHMEAAIAETQRIRSVVPVGIPHGTLDDTIIEGYRVPKGTMIVPLQWALHMDPKYWIYPELYNPGRFLDAEGRFFKPDFFMPFQIGKRVCVGEDLARMLLFLFGASVVQRFHITYPADAELDLSGECGITLMPKKHALIFTPRQNNNN